MAVFASAAHLVSWAKFCAQVIQSGGKPARGAATGHGGPWLGAAIGEAAITPARTRSFLGARYRRIVRRRGKKKALVAVGNSMLTIIWQLLPNPEEHYRDLGADFYDTHLNQLGDHHKKAAESRTQPPPQLPRRCALAFCISASITVTDAPNGDDLGPCE